MAIKIENGKIIETNILGQQKIVGSVAQEAKPPTATEIVKEQFDIALKEGLGPIASALETVLNNQKIIYDLMNKPAPEEQPKVVESEKKKK